MFPFHQNDDLSQIPCTTHHQQHGIDQDLIFSGLDSLELERINNSSATNYLTTTQDSEHTSTGVVDKDKKINRSDIERKRRREMSTLYASLRSELPLEYIKGKRSTSDHMEEAVNYIKNLEKNIQQLRHKRDELKKFSSPDSLYSGDGSSSHFFTVCPCLGGVKIVFSSGFNEEKLQLSRVMEFLLEEGLNVVTCASTKVNDKLIHTIQCEVTDPKCFNDSELQQKLYNVVTNG
ncbi:unnamed protein product [Camellia sinensis]